MRIDIYTLGRKRIYTMASEFDFRYMPVEVECRSSTEKRDIPMQFFGSIKLSVSQTLYLTYNLSDIL